MWDAAYDYVRLTYTDGGTYEDVAQVYRKIAVHCMASATGGQVSPMPWGALGYRGEDYGLVQVGTSPQGAILQATQWAAQAVREANPPFTNVPRADVQVTVWYDADPEGLIKPHANKSAAWSKARGSRGWQVRYIEGYGRGNTAYLGSRTSSTYVRIYDKGREQEGKGTYADALRYEVEFKDEQAKAAWTLEHRSAPDRSALSALVRGVLQARGVYLALPDALVAPYALPREVPAQGVDKTLIWLETSVRATLDRLQAKGVQSDYLRRILGLALEGDTDGPYRPV